MKKIDILKDRAKWLGNNLPDTHYFKLCGAYDGHRLELFSHEDGFITGYGGYEKPAALECTLQGASAMSDALHRVKCSDEDVGRLMEDFMPLMQSGTQFVEDELVVLEILVKKLARMLNPEKVQQAMDSTLLQAMADGVFTVEENDEAETA